MQAGPQSLSSFFQPTVLLGQAATAALFSSKLLISAVLIAAGILKILDLSAFQVSTEGGTMLHARE